MRSTLLVLFLVFAAVPPLGAEEEITLPEWTIGDWWEIGASRLTVSSREKSVYELIRTPKGTEVAIDGTRQTKIRMMIDGQIITRIEPDGSVTEASESSRHEWVHFPLLVGSGWAFEVLSRSRGEGASTRFEYQCTTTRWEEIAIAGRSVRGLRIDCRSGTRGSTWRWEHTVWYAPDAKRYVRLISHYSGGPTLECSAWSVRP